MKTITFYSYKGGVGRTLALCNIANRLAEFGKKVCIIDFDLEAPGIHLKYDNHIGLEGVTKGLVDYVYEFTKSGKVPTHIRDYITPVTFEELNFLKEIDLIAAGNTFKKDYWRRLSAIDWNKLFYEEEGLGVDFFLNLKEQIRSQIAPDFLLIDSRTGITEISGVTMSIFADEVVLLAANNKENLEGIGQVIKTLA
ncbi:KGGVGR-motif variant AAA ATPase, partial [Mucilaginibacter sp.]